MATPEMFLLSEVYHVLEILAVKDSRKREHVKCRVKVQLRG